TQRTHRTHRYYLVCHATAWRRGGIQVELTLKRLAFAALALAAVLLPLRKERSGSVAPSTGDRTLRLDSLYRQRRTAHISWSAFDLRDSAMRLLATGRAGTGQPAIVWRGFTREA